MQTFAAIYHRAAERHGGEEALAAKLAVPSYHDVTGEVKSDAAWLAEFTKRIFQAGFNWSVVEAKWAGFETAFWGFDPARCARLDLDDMEALTSNKDIVRNPKKIQTVPKNAAMILDMAAAKGSADAFIRSWPSDDFIGLLAYLNQQGSHLGMNTASYALRFSGVDSFVLSGDVTAALIHAGIIDKPATSKTAKRAVQAAFNDWRYETGQSLTYISRVLGYSIDAG